MVYKKGGKREIAPEYNNKVRWSIYQKAVKRFSIYLLTLEIESKRCNPSIQQEKLWWCKSHSFFSWKQNLLVDRQRVFAQVGSLGVLLPLLYSIRILTSIIFVKKHLFITVFSIYENACKRLHLCEW